MPEHHAPTIHRPLLHRPHLGLTAGLVLLAVAALLSLGVGPQADVTPPTTAFGPIGSLDQDTYDRIQGTRTDAFDGLARVLTVLGRVSLGAGVAITVAAVVALLDRRMLGATPADEIAPEDAVDQAVTG